MDRQFQLISNKDKQAQINYFSESYLQDWRHDSSEIEAAEIMAKLRWMKSKQQPCLVLLSFFYFGNVSKKNWTKYLVTFVASNVSSCIRLSQETKLRVSVA